MISALTPVLLVGLLAAARASCPVRCNCTDNSVACISRDLEYVPYFESLSNSPVIIDLSGNAIGYIDIDDFSFDKSDQVKEIYLNNSNINSIEESAFEELENLQELYLAGNLLNGLPEGFITENENLILLDISSNLFADMPKIKSDSLEVLALASSGISTVPDDALEGLPNLRVLLLQQNNLKYLEPAIFESMNNLFFVRLAYNPWRCDCKTVKLFNYLVIKKFADITEPVQCLGDDKEFVDIFDANGVTTAFTDQCNNFLVDEKFLEMEELFKNLDPADDDDDDVGFQEPFALVKMADNGDGFYVEDEDELASECLENAVVYWYLLVVIAIPLSLILGIVFGSCMTYRYMLVHVNRLKTESTKELLTHREGFL